KFARGYARATGKPMVAIVHDVVGMLHATMGIYYAYLDRCPVFVIGATGPMDESRRRPFIDWIHTANVNGEQLRHYVKWDYQPASIEGVPDSFARAYAAMMTEPQGPIYMCYDAWLQEQPLAREVVLPGVSDSKVPVRGPRRCRGARAGRRAPPHCQISDSPGRICWAQPERLRQSRGLGRNRWGSRVRRPCPAQLPEPASP